MEKKQLAGGEVLTAITNGIVQVLRERYGRGPMKGKTYILDDLVIVVLRDGFTPVEQTLLDDGHPEKVIELRRDFQVAVRDRYRELIEDLTGAKVTGFISEVSVEPDLTVEVFVLDRPARGFESLEGPFPGQLSGDGSRDRSGS